MLLAEPTSGLDARAAAMVMRVVRKIGSTGRTVVCTIHQPSAEVFFQFDDLLLMQRGGFLVYFGPVGPEGAALVGYLQGVPGAHACPAAMNPASWMLDVLAGTDSSTGADGGAAVAAAAVVEGEVLKQRLLDSQHWASCAAALDTACTPAPGDDAFVFDALYARTFGVQLQTVLRRTARSYSRAVGYIFARIKVLFVLNLMFGCVWYKAQQAVDCAPAQHADRFVCNNTPGGVQSIVGIIFINALFGACPRNAYRARSRSCGETLTCAIHSAAAVSVVCTTALLPYMMRARLVLYRERASYMYAPEAHALAHLAVELPWLLLTVFIVITPLYFMIGFTASTAAYFFYILVVWLCVLCFLSLGQWLGALFSTPAMAQAVLSLLLPLAALFSGMYLPKQQLPNGDANGHPHVFWRWAYEIDPVAHAIEALTPSRFYDAARPSTVQHKIAVPLGAGVQRIDALAFVEATRGSRYENRWNQVGYLCAIFGGLQLFHLYAVRFKVHASR
jgi:hypothetical protein